jgi:hypothetical protein
MIIPIDTTRPNWKRTAAILAVVAAVCCWIDAAREIREMQARIRFGEQLSTGLDDLTAATDAIAARRKSTNP